MPHGIMMIMITITPENIRENNGMNTKKSFMTEIFIFQCELVIYTTNMKWV